MSERLRMWAARALDWILDVRDRPRGPAAVTLPRWALRVLLAAVAVLVAALAFGGGDVFGKLATSIVTALVVGSLAWIWFYSWTSDRATLRLREEARRRPDLLFPTPPRIGSAARVVGRDDLIDDVALSLRRSVAPGPYVIVGDTGAGKTSLLLALAHRLAQNHDILPIVLSLRGREEIDFAELAKSSFKESIDPYLRSEDQAERLWRWMCRGRHVAVLADDLDRARLAGDSSDSQKAAAYAALAAARRRRLPLVVTSRNEGVPPDLPEPPVELAPLALDPDDAYGYVCARAGKHGDAQQRERVAQHIARGRLLDNPFYLELLIGLLRAEHVPAVQPEPGEHETRVSLLHAWRRGLLGVGIAEADQRRRLATLERLDAIAVGQLEIAAALEPRPEWLDDLRAGQELGVVEVDEDGGYRFAHEVVHAYFAAQALIRERTTWRGIVTEAADVPRVQLALVLAAAEMDDPQFAEDAAGALLEDAGLPDGQRLLRAIGAAEIARAGRVADGQLTAAIAAECEASLPGSAPLAKRAAIDELANLPGAGAVTALWTYAGDADYGVRWRAAERLVDRCSTSEAAPPAADAAYEVLTGKIEPALRTAEQCLDLPLEKRPDDWKPEILPLKHMAWMLPALVAASSGDVAATAGEHLTRLLALDEQRVTRQRGLEASIAQGFKVAAQLHPQAPLDGEAGEMLERSGFWYSRINLLQALALWRIHAPGADPSKKFREWGETQPHPYVRATATLCATAVEKAARGARAEALRYVWGDEGVVVSRRPSGLAPDATQLVGDITVLLNLNETGSQEQREAFGTRDDLPFCMGESRDRRELLDPDLGCHDCTFHLCPFIPAPGKSAHREISRAFCGHQRVHAHAGTARMWDSQVRREALRDFWAQMETLARG